MTQTTTGLERMAAMFAGAKAQNRAAFLPYFPIGYPTYAESLDAIAAMAAEAGFPTPIRPARFSTAPDPERTR